MKTRIKTYHLAGKHKLRIFVATDTHFEARRPGGMDEIVSEARKARPDAILLAGDTVNFLEDIGTEEARERLAGVMRGLAEIAPVYVGIGNHDQMGNDRTRSLKMAGRMQKKYIDFVESIPGEILLHNRRVKIGEGVNLIGVTLPLRCYQMDGSEATFEDEGELRKVLAEHRDLMRRRSVDETNILVIHSPRRLSNEIVEELEGIDYIICGHMHQGCVPFGLDEVLPGTVGIIAPGYMPFPVRARHTYPRHSRKLLVLPAYKTFAEHRAFLNGIYPRSLSILEIG
ncbi:metallophosphoesterase [Candidatus Saccharibacteria bacterium]|nr:metallophosphoesterase [Candidatus Saccharibacteria bacterium]